MSTYLDYDERILTFSDSWGTNNQPAARQLAKTGFYINPTNNMIQCTFCNNVYEWDSDVHYILRSHSDNGQCPIIRPGVAHESQDEAWITDYYITRLQYRNHYDINDEPILDEHDYSPIPYSQYADRKRTFDSTTPNQIMVPISNLIHSGFYYLGNEDKVQCFQCNLKLQAWEKEDDTWEEHAFWSPTCLYVQRKKGNHYIETVRKYRKSLRHTLKNLDDAINNLTMMAITPNLPMCVMCKTHKTNALTSPCNHTLTCFTCADDQMRTRGTCIICNEPMLNVYKLKFTKLLLLTLWPLSGPWATSTKPDFEFRPLSSNLGIYFEQTAMVSLYQTEYKLVVNLNLTQLHEEFHKLQKIAKSIITACRAFNRAVDSAKRFDDSCLTLIPQIENELASLHNANINWFKEKNRKRRGLVNVIGEVSKLLFGTLSENDAVQYLQKFEELTRQNKIRDEIVSKQTTLIKSTLSLLEEVNITMNSITHISNGLNERIKQIENMLSKYKQHNTYKAELTDATILLFALIHRYGHNQQKILTALSYGGRNNNIAIIIPPKTLLAELERIQAIISGRKVTLPAPPIEKNVPLYYQIGTSRSRIIDDQLVVSFSIPLADTKEFYLYKVTSFPHKMNNGYYNFILPNHDFIAVDAHREKYIAFTNTEITNCNEYHVHVNQTQLLCKQLTPILDVSVDSTTDCEITLLTKDMKSTNCDNRVANITTELWIKIREPNAYIYVFPHRQVVYITCGDTNPQEVFAEGTGVLKFADDCEIKSKKIFVKAYKIYSNDIFQQTLPHGTININISKVLQDISHIPEIHIKTIGTPSVITTGTASKLREFSSSIKEIVELESNLQSQITPMDIKRKTTFLALLITIFGIILTVLIIFHSFRTTRKIIRRQNEQKQNTPNPETTDDSGIQTNIETTNDVEE
ncbi:hypothetical protein HA402_005581 [Bradysia odoriphaga]|nr:hypothetical protein HA402_005581 [Bradysia odoriphaga]